MSQARQFSSHNQGDHGTLLCIYVDSRCVDDSLHENVRGDSRGNYGRSGSRYQYTSHSSFKNDGESVDGDGRSGYRSHTTPYTSHHSGNLGILLGFYIHG